VLRQRNVALVPCRVRRAGGPQGSMDARTNIKSRLPSWHAVAVAASGDSVNAALHPQAIAHECGIDFDVFNIAEVFKKTPYIADLKLGGRYVAKDVFEISDTPLLMKALFDNGVPHGDCRTVTGRTIAENPNSVEWKISYADA
jgi:dihydroxyacid dehydratase/phosphogluconate dehydratase